PMIIENYFNIKKSYDSISENLQKIEQKVFYILYMQKAGTNLTCQECIEELEKALKAPMIIENYFNIKKSYDSISENLQKIEQKVFYILYMQKAGTNLTCQECIEELEKALKEFKSSELKLTDARKMIQVRFKDFLNDRLGLA
ncbi:hypothetical protein BZG10_04020, partial [Salinivibrio kushneri]